MTANPEEHKQQWRTDQVQAKIARTWFELGQLSEAAAIAARLEPSQASLTAEGQALTVGPEQFDAQLEAIDAIVEAANFEQMKAALTAFVKHFDTFYADEERREACEAKLEVSWRKLPIQLRVEWLFEMAESALRHEGEGNAMRLAGKVHGLLTAYTWRPESEVPYLAGLASLRHRAGDPGTAAADAEMALGLYREKRDDIVNIYRAAALRPLAEAFHTIGDREQALIVYALALEEGFVNPNSRPRANDLAATCCSMAVAACEPNEEIAKRIGELFAALGDPW